MASNRKIQPVSFSLSDPFEERLLEHAVKNGAFSKYVKRLIQKDMERAIRVLPAKNAEKSSGNTISMGSLNGFKL